MSRYWQTLILTCMALLAAHAPCHAQPVVKGELMLDVAPLAARVDQLLAKRQAEAKTAPAPLADDAEFVRRLYLDLVGRIPSVAETRSFLADKQADRRARLMERLLASPRYGTHFAAVYRQLLIPEANTNIFVRFQQDGFESWLKKQLDANIGYDSLTRDLLTTSLGSGNSFNPFAGGPSPQAFYAAKEYKPESLAAGTARVFLGVRVECAQCHNHPTADWTRENFWALTAFFAGVQARRQNDIVLAGPEMPNKREIVMAGTDKIVQAKFLDGSEPKWNNAVSSRVVLADWVTSGANPFFAKAAVNRTWAYFLGTGLVEPVDDMIAAGNTANHAELLDLLAREFVQQKFDMKFLIRVITSTQAYQRTSAGRVARKDGSDDAALFVRMPLRGLTPEQLFDSLAMATGFRDAGNANPLGELVGGKASARSQFVTKFTNQTDRATQAQTSILQALSLMNGKVTADATSMGRSETLAALLDAPFLSTADRIETLYLATLSRRPTGKELDRANRFIDEAVRDAAADMQNTTYQTAMADVFWALLNSSEFVLNH